MSTEITFHESIRSGCSLNGGNIYSPTHAERLFYAGTHTARELSIMKQKNIRTVAEGGWSNLGELKCALNKHCGYCFKSGPNKVGRVNCKRCYLYHKLGKISCYDLKSYSGIKSAESKETFIANHRQWCNELGFKEVYGK